MPEPKFPSRPHPLGCPQAEEEKKPVEEPVVSTPDIAEEGSKEE